jgi:hypothetical protein
MTPAQQAIVRAAKEAGIDPSFALAVASRESNFNPTARASKTIRGMFQMRGDLRNQFGIGDSDDPYTQAKGWGSFIGGVKRDMRGVLGRDPTDAEAYLGHHFGARRAARMLQDDPNTPVDAVFTPQEMALNPHFARAGTVGALNSSVEADIGKRMASYGGGQTALPDLSNLGEPVESPTIAPDLSSLGDPVEPVEQASTAPQGLPDLSSLGEPV